MALGAAEWDEDVRLPAPNRDRDGADVFTGAFNGGDTSIDRTLQQSES